MDFFVRRNRGDVDFKTDIPGNQLDSLFAGSPLIFLFVNFFFQAIDLTGSLPVSHDFSCHTAHFYLNKAQAAIGF